MVCRGSTLASLPHLHFTLERGGRMSFQNIGVHTVSAQKATLWEFSCSCIVSLSYATWLCNVSILESVVKSVWRHSRWNNVTRHRTFRIKCVCHWSAIHAFFQHCFMTFTCICLI
jgi:hypothetical protein